MDVYRDVVLNVDYYRSVMGLKYAMLWAYFVGRDMPVLLNLCKQVLQITVLIAISSYEVYILI